MVFSIMLGWLPTIGRGETVEVLGIGLSILTWDGIKHITLPALNLSIFAIALLIRLVRAGMLETLSLDYVKFARAKGVPTARIVFAQVARGAALVELRKEYIESVRCLSLSATRIVLRHLLPNCLPPLIVIGTVEIAHAIALEATLSFLGVGMPITEPSLGLLIANGYGYLLSGRYWISFFPGIALLITIASINFVGDRLRDVLNPRLQR